MSWMARPSRDPAQADRDLQLLRLTEHPAWPFLEEKVRGWIKGDRAMLDANRLAHDLRERVDQSLVSMGRVEVGERLLRLKQELLGG